MFSLENSDSFDENHENTLYPQTRITKKGLRQQNGRFWNVIAVLAFTRHVLKNAYHEEKSVEIYKVCESLLT